MAESNPTRPWGPDNPHPLSTMKTELVWEGKYDEFGNRREVDVAGSSMPMQKIETIDQPRSEAASKGGEFLLDFENTTSRNDDFRNRLIWGDNKLVMASLLKEFRGSIDLIYIDPPFDVNADFSVAVPVGSENEVLTKGQSVMELVAYNDTWGLGADSYLHMLWERLNVLRELLADDGSLFVHVGPEVSESVRLVLDSVFGQENLRNQIILPGRAVKNLQQQFQNIGRLQIRHDVLYWYSKRDSTRFPQIWSEKHDKGNPEGHWHHFWSTADRPTMRYELFGTTPKSGQWVWKESRAKIAVENFERFLKEAGGRTLAQYWRDTGKKLEFIRRSPDDGKPQYWRAPAEDRLADTIWAGLPIYSSSTSYPTEKSERFLSFIVENFTKESDLIADFFCGSGTAGSVAEKLGRRWIMADLGRYAIHTSRKRMIDVQRDLADQQKPYC